MFLRLIITTSLGLSLLTSIGCDQQAAQEERSREKFAEAVHLVEQATQGYVATEKGATKPHHMEKYQADKLAKALEQLQAYAAEAAPNHKAAAQRIIGNIHARQARETARAARTAFANVQGQSTGLLNYVSAVEQVNDAIISRTRDGEPTLQDIRKAEGMIDEGKSRLTASVAELSLQREEIVSKARKFQSEAQRTFAEAGDIEDKAFALEDPRQQQLAYTQAYSVKRQGEAIRHRGQLAQIDADLINAKLVPLETELKLWDRMAEQLDTLAERVKADDASAAEDVSASKDIKATTQQTVREQYELLVASYQSEVVERLQAAAALGQDAVTQLEEAANAATGPQKENVQFDLLAARVEQSHILSLGTHCNANFAKIIEAVLKSPPIEGDAKSFFSAEQDRFAERGDELAAQAREAIDAADEMTKDSAFGDAGQAMADVLQQYRGDL